jgi:hypothetical protein
MLPLSSLMHVKPSSTPPLPPPPPPTSNIIPMNVQLAHEEFIRDIRYIVQDCTEVSLHCPTKQFSVLTVNGCKTMSLANLKRIAELTCVSVGDVSLSLNDGSMSVSFHCFEDTSLCSCPSRLGIATVPRSRKRPRPRGTCEESSIKAITTRIKNDFPDINTQDGVMIAHVIRAIDMLQGDETPMHAATQVRELESGGWAIDVTGFTHFTFAQLQHIEDLFPLHVDDVQIQFGPRQATVSLHSYTKPSWAILH